MPNMPVARSDARYAGGQMPDADGQMPNMPDANWKIGKFKCTDQNMNNPAKMGEDQSIRRGDYKETTLVMGRPLFWRPQIGDLKEILGEACMWHVLWVRQFQPTQPAARARWTEAKYAGCKLEKKMRHKPQKNTMQLYHKYSKGSQQQRISFYAISFFFLYFF